MLKRMSYALCSKGMITQPLCEILIYLIGGFSNGEFNHVSYRNCGTGRRIGNQMTGTIPIRFLSDFTDYIARCVFSGGCGEIYAILSRGMLVQTISPLRDGHSKSRYRFAINRVLLRFFDSPFMRARIRTIYVHNFPQTDKLFSFAGRFQLYDHGILSNIRNYKRVVPPEYPVHKITAPIVLYVGLNDWLAHPKVDQGVAQFSFVIAKSQKLLNQSSEQRKLSRLRDYPLDLVFYFGITYHKILGC